MIAYLSGLLPLAYTLSSLDAYSKYRALNVQAGCRCALQSSCSACMPAGFKHTITKLCPPTVSRQMCVCSSSTKVPLCSLYTGVYVLHAMLLYTR